MFTYFKERRLRREKAKSLYNAIEAQGRLPVFYENYGVPDTVDGRFEMIALHCYIMMRRLNKAGEKKLTQTLFDVFFKIMDRSLREQGVGDLGVPKHMKRMMKGFNGRANHYEQAINNNNDEELKQAIIKNIYGTIETPEQHHVEQMAFYIKDNTAIESTEAVFADPSIKEQKVA